MNNGIRKTFTLLSDLKKNLISKKLTPIYEYVVHTCGTKNLSSLVLSLKGTVSREKLFS